MPTLSHSLIPPPASPSKCQRSQKDAQIQPKGTVVQLPTQLIPQVGSLGVGNVLPALPGKEALAGSHPWPGDAPPGDSPSPQVWLRYPQLSASGADCSETQRQGHPFGSVSLGPH